MDNIENFEDTSQGDYYDDPDTLDSKTLGNFSFLRKQRSIYFNNSNNNRK